jgi:hypothetical protein
MLQEFTQEIKNLTGDMINNVHTTIPGIIKSFNPAKCEAEVTPSAQFNKPNGDKMNYPECSSVPVLFPQGAGQSAVIAWPVKAGDKCLLFFAEQSLDAWRSGAEAKTDLKHDLSNAVAFVGLFDKPSPIIQEACSTNSIIISNGGSKFTLGGSGATVEADNVTIKASNINLQAGTIALNGAVSCPGYCNGH